MFGDFVGSVYEFKKRVSYSFAPLFHEKSAITDDTICSLAEHCQVNEQTQKRAITRV
jgi:hypothetical protein